jgi:hypothetical protein
MWAREADAPRLILQTGLLATTASITPRRFKACQAELPGLVVVFAITAKLLRRHPPCFKAKGFLIFSSHNARAVCLWTGSGCCGLRQFSADSKTVVPADVGDPYVNAIGNGLQSRGRTNLAARRQRIPQTCSGAETACRFRPLVAADALLDPDSSDR